MLEPADKFSVGVAQSCLRIDPRVAGEIGDGEQQIANLFGLGSCTVTAQSLFSLGEFFPNFFENGSGVGPVKPHPRSAFGELAGACQRGKTYRNIIKQGRGLLSTALAGLIGAFASLDGLPALFAGCGC